MFLKSFGTPAKLRSVTLQMTVCNVYFYIIHVLKFFNFIRNLILFLFELCCNEDVVTKWLFVAYAVFTEVNLKNTVVCRWLDTMLGFLELL
jgi:hypothetical protein